MAWFVVDDRWHSHPKVQALSLGAAGLWAKAGSWCMDYLTDGKIGRATVVALGGNDALASELVCADLWDVDADGWIFHDWFDMQRSRKDVMKKRKDDRVRKGYRTVSTSKDSTRNPRGSANDSDANPVLPKPEALSPKPEARRQECESQTRLTHSHVRPPQAGEPPPDKIEPNLVLELRKVFTARFLAAQAAPPNERALSSMVVSVSAWIEKAAPLRSLTELELCRRLLAAFFASPKAAQNRFSPGFLAHDPDEWLNPSTSQPSASSGRQRAADVPPPYLREIK